MLSNEMIPDNIRPIGVDRTLGEPSYVAIERMHKDIQRFFRIPKELLDTLRLTTIELLKIIENERL